VPSFSSRFLFFLSILSSFFTCSFSLYLGFVFVFFFLLFFLFILIITNFLLWKNHDHISQILKKTKEISEEILHWNADFCLFLELYPT